MTGTLFASWYLVNLEFRQSEFYSIYVFLFFVLTWYFWKNALKNRALDNISFEMYALYV